jgi:hypothetical protein
MTESQLNQINNELAEQGQLVQVSDPNQDIYIQSIRETKTHNTLTIKEAERLLNQQEVNMPYVGYTEPLNKPIESQDLLFLRNTKEWPTFQDGETRFCCLRNATKKLHGFIVEGSFAVNHGYIFNGGNGSATIYESYEQIVADGWTVD